MLKIIWSFLYSIFVKKEINENLQQTGDNDLPEKQKDEYKEPNNSDPATAEDEVKVEPIITKQMKILTGTDCLKKYGWGYDLLSTPDINEQLHFERKWMTVLLVLPRYASSSLPKKIYCNKDLVEPLNTAFENMLLANILKDIKTWDGCFNPRPIRGYEEKFKALIKAGKNDEAAELLSIHTWGIAIDVNAAWNRLGATPTLSKYFVECWVDAGFDWGGDFKRLDGMHFALKADKI